MASQDLADKKKPHHTIDGQPRSPKVEAELNELAVATFGRGNGAKFLDYLKQLTSSATLPSITDQELRHLAGQRYLVWIIENRVDRGKKDRQDV